VHRSQLTVDLAAVRGNVHTLLDGLGGAQLWVVVKANAYGHGASDIAGAALGAGASALCVATVPEALALRREFPAARIIAMGPSLGREVGQARDARIELVVSSEEVPPGVRVHLKLDTGMGRWGIMELTSAPALEVVGLMSHLATADTDAAYAEWQIERFRAATAPYTHLERHIANSAAALRYPSAAFDAARCGIAVLGLSPFGTDPSEDGLQPVLGWTSYVAESKLLRRGESTGYGRRFVAERDTWVGIVPVGYADGFRRELTGTTVRVGDEPRRVIGTVSMDAFAVELDAEAAVGTPVVLIGPGVLVEEHARVANTITHDLVCRINSDPSRARRVVLDS
jgi:alanine racemase